MKFTSKSEFLEATQHQWELLWALSDSIKLTSTSEKRLKQILGHLYSWHRLVVGWVNEGENEGSNLPAKGFNWQQTRQLNAKFDEANADIEFSSVVRRLKLSHAAVLKIVLELSDEQFLRPGHFNWTGKNAIASYIVPNTFSHYRWAIKKIKRIK